MFKIWFKFLWWNNFFYCFSIHFYYLCIVVPVNPLPDIMLVMKPGFLFLSLLLSKDNKSNELLMYQDTKGYWLQRFACSFQLPISRWFPVKVPQSLLNAETLKPVPTRQLKLHAVIASAVLSSLSFRLFICLSFFFCTLGHFFKISFFHWIGFAVPMFVKA